MKYRTPGRTGIKAGPYAPGAMMSGARGNTDHDDCPRIVHTALDAGIDFIDTADACGRGESEEILAAALKGRWDDVAEAQRVADRRGLQRFRAEQPPYSILDRIDAIVAPGTGVGALDVAYNPPALTGTTCRRRPTATRDAA
ncbi:aldo/keto reductase [Streptomyces poriferorum]|uniref:aldo/keto reductase n=1 Tax=Streptomyces poriferorum TaxID=2798799 RepID=UPI0035322E4B